MTRLLTLIILLLALQTPAAAQKKNNPDSKTLGKALDYFSGGKYHEALMLLAGLDKKYKLNPRFKAYMGICYYHEWDYRRACRYLDEALPDLEVYAPQERNIYYNTAAESHFMLEEYDMALPLYEKQLLVCHENEKGDVFYRLGFCHMFKADWQSAADNFTSALLYYERYPVPERAPRTVQLEKMIKGCNEKIKEAVSK